MATSKDKWHSNGGHPHRQSWQSYPIFSNFHIPQYSKSWPHYWVPSWDIPTTSIYSNSPSSQLCYSANRGSLNACTKHPSSRSWSTPVDAMRSVIRESFTSSKVVNIPSLCSDRFLRSSYVSRDIFCFKLIFVYLYRVIIISWFKVLLSTFRSLMTGMILLAPTQTLPWLSSLPLIYLWSINFKSAHLHQVSSIMKSCISIGSSGKERFLDFCGFLDCWKMHFVVFIDINLIFLVLIA